MEFGWPDGAARGQPKRTRNSTPPLTVFEAAGQTKQNAQRPPTKSTTYFFPGNMSEPNKALPAAVSLLARRSVRQHSRSAR